jgi:hypothetical protein
MLLTVQTNTVCSDTVGQKPVHDNLTVRDIVSMLDGWFRHRLLGDVMFQGAVWDADSGGTAKFKQLRVHCFPVILSNTFFHLLALSSTTKANFPVTTG